MAKYLNSAGVTYLWKKIKALLAKPFTVSAGDSAGNYTKVGGGSVATGNSDGDQTIIDNNGVTVSGGALTIYEDTSKGGGSVVIDYDEATRLKGLKNYTLPAANGTTLGGVKSGGDVTIASGVITVNDDSHNHTIANVDGLQTALNAKAPLASPTFTGTPKAPTAASGTNTTQIATTAFVQAAVDRKIATADAMRFKGTLGTGGTTTALPASHKVGDTYKVIAAGTYAGQKCEAGDMVVCVTSGTTANDAHWTVIQANVDGAVTGPASAVAGHVATFSSTTGKVIKDSGFTIAKSVPADAKFTDTTYGLATTSANGLMSKEDKGDFDMLKSACGARESAGTVNRNSQTVDLEWEAVFYTDDDGFYTDPQSVTLPYATTSAAGVMTSAMCSKLEGIATGATADSAMTETDIDAAIAAAV